MWILNGVTYWYMQGETIYGFPESFRAIGSGYWLGVPVPVYLMVIVLAAGLVFARMTTWGHQVYAMGANQQAAHLSGVPVNARTSPRVFAQRRNGRHRRRRVSRPFEFSGSRHRRRSCCCPRLRRCWWAARRCSADLGSLIGTLIGATILTLVLNGMNLLVISSNWAATGHGGHRAARGRRGHAPHAAPRRRPRLNARGA